MFCIRCFDEVLFGDVEAACITPLVPLLLDVGDTVWLESWAASTVLLSALLLEVLLVFPSIFDFFFLLVPLDGVLPLFSAVSSGVLGASIIIFSVVCSRYVL